MCGSGVACRRLEEIASQGLSRLFPKNTGTRKMLLLRCVLRKREGSTVQCHCSTEPRTTALSEPRGYWDERNATKKESAECKKLVAAPTFVLGVVSWTSTWNQSTAVEGFPDMYIYIYYGLWTPLG